MKDFRALLQEFDPKGRFQNGYMREHIGEG